ncbi:MAG: hypothetical protein HYU63_03930 [Armatimonadetes bacterium]|nr:hypothetical protein [Armatimonadota bacterium]
MNYLEKIAYNVYNQLPSSSRTAKTAKKNLKNKKNNHEPKVRETGGGLVGEYGADKIKFTNDNQHLT